MERKVVRSEAIESISERLSALEDLYFPRALQSTIIDPSQRKAILLDLLSRDAAVFLGKPLLNPSFQLGFYFKTLSFSAGFRKITEKEEPIV